MGKQVRLLCKDLAREVSVERRILAWGEWIGVAERQLGGMLEMGE